MIRVLHYIGSLEYGGSQAFVMNIYRKIDREQLQFDFITFPGETDGYHDEILSLGGRIYPCPRYRGTNHAAFVTWWKTFFREHKEYKVLHGHVRSVASIYIPIAKKAGLCTIAHSHSTSNGTGMAAKVKDIMQFPVRFQADYLFACSDEAGKWMFGKSVTNRKNYSVICNAVDIQRFSYNEKVRLRNREKLQLDDSYVIGTVGRLTEPKNHKFLIDIFHEIYALHPKVVLLIIGDGGLKFELEKRVDELGLHESVIFAGDRSNVQDYYMMMDVFAFPSLWEGLGIAAIEAQCSGLHCVVSDRVPRSVDIHAGLVDFVALDDKETWKRQLEKSQCDRKSQDEFAKKAGYDILDTAYKMQEFYIARSRE